MNQIVLSQPVIGSAEQIALAECLRSGQLTQADRVARFEREFGRFLGVSEVVAVSNGTAAIHLTLAALGVGPGDEVIVPDLTFVATANAVRYCGATPVLCDVDRDSWCIDPRRIGRLVTSRTKAVIAVHLYGVPCDMEAIQAALPTAIPIIEDAAEGLGGYLAGRPLGTIGIAGTFSFYGNKVMTTGEGGAIAVRSETLARRMRHLRGQAMSSTLRYYHDEVGFNYRMTEMQAALGIAQLRQLPSMLAIRCQVMQKYHNSLRTCVTEPQFTDADLQAPWLYTALVDDPVTVARVAHERSIDTRPVFVPLHMLPPYRRTSAEFPIAGEIARLGISLPTHPSLSEDDVERVCQVVLECAS